MITVCVGKSTYARCGIIVNVTPFEPEWEGIVTLEVSNTTPLPARIYAGEGIAQVLFFESDEVCETSYADKKGKYQAQQGLTLPAALRRLEGAMVHETVTLEGHLIDSDILRRVFDRVVEEGGEFEVQEFRVGRTNDEPSFARVESGPRTRTRSTGSSRRCATWGRPPRSATRASRRRRRTASCPTTSTPRPTSTPSCGSTGRWVEARDQKMDSRRRPARRRAPLREAGGR